MKNKIIQITSGSYTNISGELIPFVYGLAEDGSTYSLNMKDGEWEFIADSPVDEK